jgi:hypothetical protein
VEAVVTEFKDTGLVLGKNLFDICRRTIAQANPNGFGGEIQKRNFVDENRSPSKQ